MACPHVSNVVFEKSSGTSMPCLYAASERAKMSPYSESKIIFWRLTFLSTILLLLVK